jgi:hypothetical protein
MFSTPLEMLMSDPRHQPGISGMSLIKLFLARNTSAIAFFSWIRSGRFPEIMKNDRIIPDQEEFNGRNPSAGILEQSTGARNRIGIVLSYRARIFKLLRRLRIDSKEPIPPGCVAWRSTTTLFLLSSHTNTGPLGHIGWPNQFLGIDSWAP